MRRELQGDGYGLLVHLKQALVRAPGFLVMSLALLPVIASAQVARTAPDSVGPVPTTIGAQHPLLTALSNPTFFPRPEAAQQPPAATQDTNALSVRLLSRLESRLERNENNRCTTPQNGISVSSCRAIFQPLFDFDFNLLAGGRVANRVRVDVDYDSKREFDASNNVALSYTGAADEVIQHVEIGNVSFAPPFSRLITTGIPKGNYGIYADGRAGPFTFQAIAAQQKGRIVHAESFTLGDRALRSVSASLEDYSFEPRRFFFTVDPAQFAGYPNIDILNGQEMLVRAAMLADTLRPRSLALYRVLLGGQPPNPNGPQFIARGARNQSRGLVYEHLREGIDYYADPSLLWIALTRQLRRDERLVVAYTVLLADGTTIHPTTGGTPDLQFRPEPQFANLLWDPELQATDGAFRREIRSAYRLAGEDLVRQSTELRVVTGPATGQEKPPAGGASSYLELFGLSRPSSAAAFDNENRIWPRVGDPNLSGLSAGVGTPLIYDYFVIFPSLRPFATDGLVTVGNPSNDTIYTMLSEDIYSSRRPRSVFNLLVKFATGGENEPGTLSLGNVQVRPGSERLVVDGVLLVRGDDYQVDYELGRVIFIRPDTLFTRRREISVQYEENPIFAETPTSIVALAARLPLASGSIGFTAINQSQRSTFSRPSLGFEPAASFLAGLNAAFSWRLPGLARVFGGGDTATVGGAAAGPLLRLNAELATSLPNPNSRNTAFIESFQGEGGLSANVSDALWYFASQPSPSALLTAEAVSAGRASTMAWQNFALGTAGTVNTFRSDEIDPNISLLGQFSTPEPLLWLTLYPLSVAGARNSEGTHDWTVAGTLPGRRWRSLRTSLSPSGADLTRVEHIEFWGLVDTSAVGRPANPTIVIDLGDISENTFTFSPDSLLVDAASGAFGGFRGRRLQGQDVLNSERDAFSRAFDASVNDVGIAGDVADRLLRFDAFSGAPLGDSLNVPTCSADRRILSLGDSRANCTVQNARLDEEDLDGDGVLNFPSDAERLLRFSVDMSDPASFDRIGSCLAAGDPRVPATPGATKCWVHFRIPFSTAELVGTPVLRRIKAMRLTVVSGAGAADDAFTYLPLTRVILAGAPWQKRSDRTITGIAGEGSSAGIVSASLIGTRDSSSALPYQPPPGVREEAEGAGQLFSPSQIQINERSLRIRATDMALLERAEAFFKFPDGQKNFMGYTQLRVWARGRNSGWGDSGELNFFMRLGRDADNFYLFRQPANSGSLQSAWEPEMRLDFSRFFSLRSRLQEAFQSGSPLASSCSATDSALVAVSALPGSSAGNRYFACDGPYMIYTVDPAVSPPSLGAVQELSVGMVRVGEGGGMNQIAAGDTLELWVDEIRLTGVVGQQGYAGHVEVELTGSGLADLRVDVSRRDRNFRQLAEQPSFLTQDALNISSTVRLEHLSSTPLGWSLPLTISHSTALSDPYFVSSSDILAGGLPGVRSPRDARTAYSLVARRTAPSDGSTLQNILAGLVFTGNYSAADSRSEYSVGRGASYGLGAALNLSGATSWWKPTLFRMSSSLARRSDSRTAFLNPGESLGDVGLRVEGLSHLWRNSSTVEFRPLPDLTARMELSSDRDLRDYGDGTPVARAASDARGSLFGLDAGMERERGVRGLLNYSVSPIPWLDARFSATTRFVMTRDPDSRFALVDPSDAEVGILPRRLSGSQQLSAGLTIDFGELASNITGDSLRGAAVSRAFGPLDLRMSRGLMSAFNASGAAPSLLYQFSLGGAGSFRSQGGQRATIAGSNRTLSAGHTVRPFAGASVMNRVSFSQSNTWSGLLADTEYRVDGTARTFPDVTLRLERAGTASSLIQTVVAQGGVRRTSRSTHVPSFITPLAPDRSRDIATSLPASISVVWGALGGLTTSAEHTHTLRNDLRPGIEIDGESHYTTADIRKVIPAGTFSWLTEDIRTRVSFSSSVNKSSITNSASLVNSRLVDNGRYSIGFSADSDVSPTMVLSFGASQIVTYDRNFNRRFTQTLFSAILHIDLSIVDFR